MGYRDYGCEAGEGQHVVVDFVDKTAFRWEASLGGKAMQCTVLPTAVALLLCCSAQLDDVLALPSLHLHYCNTLPHRHFLPGPLSFALQHASGHPRLHPRVGRGQCRRRHGRAQGVVCCRPPLAMHACKLEWGDQPRGKDAVLAQLCGCVRATLKSRACVHLHLLCTCVRFAESAGTVLDLNNPPADPLWGEPLQSI